MRTVQQALANGSVSPDSAYHAAQILFDSGLNDAAARILASTLQDDSVYPNRLAAEQLQNRIRNN